jgi:MFS family permease
MRIERRPRWRPSRTFIHLVEVSFGISDAWRLENVAGFDGNLGYFTFGADFAKDSDTLCRVLLGEHPLTAPNVRARYTLFILFAINLLNFYDRNIPAAIVEPLRKDWGLSDLQIGLLGTAFTLLYAVVGVPFGRLSDRVKRSKLLGLGLAVWSLLTAACGLAWNYRVLFAARLGVGVGEATCAPAANSLIGDLYPAGQRARALSLFTLGLPLGGFLGIFLSGRIAASYGWRTPFYVACIPGLILALLALTISEPPRGAAEISPDAGRPMQGSLIGQILRILRIPSMRWIIASGAVFNFNMYAIPTFLAAFLHRYHALNERDSSAVAAVVYSAVGIPGLLLGGWVADHAGKRRPSGRLLVSAFAVMLQAPLAYLALNRAPGEVLSFAVLMGIGGMVSYVYYSGVYATIQDLIPPSLRGTGMAVYFCVMYLMGASFGPLITGGLSDHYARAAMKAVGASKMAEAFRATGLHSAMYVIPVCALAVGLVLLMAARSVAADMHEMHVWMAQPAGKPAVAAET